MIRAGLRPNLPVGARLIIRQLGWGLLLILAFTLPFELDRPLLNLGPLAVTNLELLQGLILLTALLVWLVERPSGPLPHAGWLLLLASGLMFVGTAILAPEENGNAVKASLRLLGGVALALSVPLLVRQRRQRSGLLLAIMAGCLLAAMIGLAEVWLGREFGWLTPWRSGITVTGAFFRLTGPLDYANLAAMLIEVNVLIVLAVGWLWWRRTRRTAVLMIWLTALLLLLQASFQTLSRASFVTIAAVAFCLAVLIGWRRQMARPWIGLVGLVVAMFVLNSVASEVFRLRFSSEGDNGWYETSWQVPPALTMVANEVQAVPITVSNEGALTWRSDRAEPIHLGGRWIEVESGLQLAEPRWAFNEAVAPGESVMLELPVRAPAAPGSYQLIWDVVQENITWFGAKSGVFATSSVQVLPSAVATDAPGPQTAVPAWAYELPIPGRLVLWQVAFQLFRERPLLGVGLDNYRLVYGRHLGATSWNETIHTNNWFLEFLVGGGLLAALPFFAWLAWEGIFAWQRRRDFLKDPWLLAIFGGLLAFLVHGLLDFFLLFNSTGLLFWLLVGMWWQSFLGRSNAHRV